MSLLIGIVCFLWINFYGLKLILGKPFYSMWNPSGPPIQINRGEAFLLFTSFSVMIAGIQEGGSMAIRLLLWIILTVLLIVMRTKGRRMLYTPVLGLYIAYLGWALLSLFYASSLWEGLRVFAKYLLPLFLMVAAGKMVEKPLVSLRIITYTFRALLITVICYYLIGIFKLNILQAFIGHLLWWGPAVVDSLSVAIPCTWVLLEHTRRHRYWVILLFFACWPAWGTVRTGVAGVVCCLLLLVFFKYKVRALPWIFFVLAIGTAAVLYIPGLRDKTFYDTSFISDDFGESIEHISLDNVNSSGRFRLWDGLLHTYYSGRELTGSGLGSVQSLMREQRSRGLQDAAHNDYVQILCDTGLIGLILYAAVLLTLIVHSFLLYNNRRNNPYARYAALVAGCSMGGLMVTMYFDNVVNYSMITLSYPFLFYGISIALKDKPNDDQRSNSTVQ